MTKQTIIELAVGILLLVFCAYTYEYKGNTQYINPKECTESKWSHRVSGETYNFSEFKCRSSSNEVDSIAFTFDEDGQYCSYYEYYSNGTLLRIDEKSILVLKDSLPYRRTILKATSDDYGLKVSCDELYKRIMSNLKK